MKLVRKILLKILGLKGFIKFISRIYILLVQKGFLKKQYPELFYLNTIVNKGSTCIDIGANVGYYSTMLSRIVGEEGKVFAIEPIPMFVEIWRNNVKRSGVKNLEMFPYALGAENITVQMGIPQYNGVVHHGMTKITSTGDADYVKTFDVEMRIPNELFKNINRLDFIKCDVEGYESEVFSNMIDIIEKFKPKVQSELGGLENRMKVISIFRKLNYSVNILSANNKLVEVNDEQIKSTNKDFYFIPN